MKHRVCLFALLVGGSVVVPVIARADCEALADAAGLKAHLIAAASTGGDAGGWFHGTKEWAAVVNRDGKVCATVTSSTDNKQVWPAGRSAAEAKAYTANGFSLDSLAMSTARLYTLAQPGHSFFGLGQANPVDDKLIPPNGRSVKRMAGGTIPVGGGVPLYDAGGHVIGGLGVAGDTPCADHEMAKRVRTLMGYDPPGGAAVDDITYSSADGASVFTHPLCPNTFRNGILVGNEASASGY
jgi:uncharacterized protein GlcG (DUF336 family)